MDRNLIKLCWDAIQRHTTRDTECLELYQVLEILSKEMEELQAEVEGLKCCANCKHSGNYQGMVDCEHPKFDSENVMYGKLKCGADDKCSNWQKAGD